MPRPCTRCLCGLFAVITLVGCPGSLEDPSRFGVGADGGPAHCDDAVSVVTNLFETRCGSSSCHGAGSSAIDLVSPDVEARLIDQRSEACTDQIFVSSSNPGTSYLLNKVTEAAACGSPMPLGGTLSPVELACLQSWVGSITSSAGPGTMDAGAPPMDASSQDADAEGGQAEDAEAGGI